MMIANESLFNGCLVGLHVDELAAFLARGEDNHTVNERKERMILTHTDVQSGMVHGAALTLDDVAGFAIRSTKNLNSETFTL